MSVDNASWHPPVNALRGTHNSIGRGWTPCCSCTRCAGDTLGCLCSCFGRANSESQAKTRRLLASPFPQVHTCSFFSPIPTTPGSIHPKDRTTIRFALRDNPSPFAIRRPLQFLSSTSTHTAIVLWSADDTRFDRQFSFRSTTFHNHHTHTHIYLSHV